MNLISGIGIQLSNLVSMSIKLATVKKILLVVELKNMAIPENRPKTYLEYGLISYPQ